MREGVRMAVACVRHAREPLGGAVFARRERITVGRDWESDKMLERKTENCDN